MTKRTVLVTGASSGLGAAIARRFARRGDRVFGTSRRQLATTADGVVMLELDLRAQDSINRCVAEVRVRGGDIDVLVNNAGVLHTGMVEETTSGATRDVFEINFFGAVSLIDAILPTMRTRRSGRIINVGSLSAWVGEPGEAFYSASKRALAGYTEALRQEVSAFGIKVSLVEPGVFQTNVVRDAMANSDRIADYDSVRKAVDATLAKGIGKGGNPEDVARLVFDIARDPAPRLRYPVGTDAKILPYLKLLLPQRVFEYLLRRGYGLAPANR